MPRFARLRRVAALALSPLLLAACRTADEGDPDTKPAGSAAEAAEAAAEGAQASFGSDQTIAPVAFADIDPAASNGGAMGIVEFFEAEGGLRVRYRLTNLVSGLHGLHVHEGTSCADGPDGAAAGAAGSHFNPLGTPHGAPTNAPAARHAGDLGNVQAEADGNATGELVSVGMQLQGPQGILGRAVIVHADADDYDAQPAGDAGGRVGCGVVRPAVDRADDPEGRDGQGQRGGSTAADSVNEF